MLRFLLLDQERATDKLQRSGYAHRRPVAWRRVQDGGNQHGMSRGVAGAEHAVDLPADDFEAAGTTRCAMFSLILKRAPASHLSSD
jgi:hypothetical protein